MKKRRIRKSFLVTVIALSIVLVISLFYLLFLKSDQGVNSDKYDIYDPTLSITDPLGTSYLNEITYDVEVEEGIKDVIVEYFDVYYNAIKELTINDLTYLFDDPQSEDALMNQYAVSLLVETRKMKANDLSLNKAAYDLEFSEVVKDGEITKMTVLEDNYLNFEFMKDIESRVYNVKNEFTLRKSDDGYKILEYNKVQDFYVMFTDLYNGGGEEELKKIKGDYLALFEKKLSEDRQDYEAFLKGEDKPYKECDHLYDRKAAAAQLVWVDDRDPDWMVFDSNCQNFASQVLYAGGIPMDHYGDADKHLQWKGYGYDYNASQTPEGLVYTWTFVPYFYTYAKDNTGYGLCADVDVNLYYGEVGDVIQVGPQGPTRHTLVVSGTYEKEGQLVDILVNSNTVDLENYPISAYAYPYVSLIKIYGWNE